MKNGNDSFTFNPTFTMSEMEAFKDEAELTAEIQRRKRAFRDRIERASERIRHALNELYRVAYFVKRDGKEIRLVRPEIHRF